MLGLTAIFFSFLSLSASTIHFDKVAVGSGFACGHNQNQIKCWGNGEYGRIRPLSGFEGIKSIELGVRYGCVLDSIGIACWGLEQPDLDPTLSNNPEIVSFNVFEERLCALRNDSRIICNHLNEFLTGLVDVEDFGMNSYVDCALSKGEVICSGSSDPLNPFIVPGNLGEVTSLSVSVNKACIVNTKSQIICWGHDQRNFFPPFKVKSVHATREVCALGFQGEIQCTHKDQDENVPRGFGRVVALAGEHSGVGDGYCGINEKNETRCWGSYHAGKPPVEVATNPRFIGADRYYSFIVNEDGKLFNVGVDGSFSFLPEAVQTYNLRALSIGSQLCYYDDLGLKCFNSNFFNSGPKPPQGLGPLKSLAGNFRGTCAINTADELHCWGDETTVPSKNMMKSKKIVGKEYNFCSLRTDNKVTCWGDGNQLASPISSSPSFISDLAVGGSYACVLYEDQAIQCWGKEMPANIVPPSYNENITNIISGTNFVCVYGEKNIFCWGDNRYQQLIPPSVVGSIHMAVAGDTHACLRDNEGVKCWGDNSDGQCNI